MHGAKEREAHPTDKGLHKTRTGRHWGRGPGPWRSMDMDAAGAWEEAALEKDASHECPGVSGHAYGD